jgi:hypothetical protein
MPGESEAQPRDFAFVAPFGFTATFAFTAALGFAFAAVFFGAGAGAGVELIGASEAESFFGATAR